MVGTGPAGFALIVYFTINAMFAGSRLGLCWVMITERYPEFRDGVSYRRGTEKTRRSILGSDYKDHL